MATNHINISLTGKRQDTYAKLQKLAETKGLRVTDIVWGGAEAVLANPKLIDGIQASAGAAPRAGSARGFWVQHKLNASQRLEGVSIVEVAQRSDATGATFFRYSSGDAKARGRALTSAQRTAAYDAKLAGVQLKDGNVPVTELKDKEGKAAPAAPKQEAPAGNGTTPPPAPKK